MKRTLIALGAAIPLCLAGVALANDNVNPTPSGGQPGAVNRDTGARGETNIGQGNVNANVGQGNISDTDQSFLKKAASAGLFEVQAANLALSKSTDPTVKQFAQKMLTDHTQANDQLKSICDRKGIAMPTAMLPEDQDNLTQLQNKTGKDFDKTYMDQQNKAHAKVVQLFQNEAKSGNDQDLKSFAQSTLPTLKQHHNMAGRSMHRM